MRTSAAPGPGPVEPVVTFGAGDKPAKKVAAKKAAATPPDDFKGIPGGAGGAAAEEAANPGFFKKIGGWFKKATDNSFFEAANPFKRSVKGDRNDRVGLFRTVDEFGDDVSKKGLKVFANYAIPGAAGVVTGAGTAVVINKTEDGILSGIKKACGEGWYAVKGTAIAGATYAGSLIPKGIMRLLKK